MLTHPPATDKPARPDPTWEKPTTIERPAGHVLTTGHVDFRRYLADLASEIDQRPGRFSSWMAHHLAELAAEARTLEAADPLDFDDRRATMAEIAARLR